VNETEKGYEALVYTMSAVTVQSRSKRKPFHVR